MANSASAAPHLSERVYLSHSVRNNTSKYHYVQQTLKWHQICSLSPDTTIEPQRSHSAYAGLWETRTAPASPCNKRTSFHPVSIFTAYTDTDRYRQLTAKGKVTMIRLRSRPEEKIDNREPLPRRRDRETLVRICTVSFHVSVHRDGELSRPPHPAIYAKLRSKAQAGSFNVSRALLSSLSSLCRLPARRSPATCQLSASIQGSC